jgi:transaldolase
MEALADAGGDLTQMASVASFFVSRVDTNVDGKLQRVIDAGGPDAERAAARLGTAAVDNAKLAYETFEQAFTGPRFQALERQGARVQRPLWASTSTKNPAYRDVVYVEELIAERTVNTMPLATIEAFADHGEIRGQTIHEDLERAHALWPDLAQLGIDEAQVGKELELDGVEKFAESYQAVLDTVERKRAEAVR